MAKLTYSTGWFSGTTKQLSLPTTAIALHAHVKQMKKDNPKLTTVLFSADFGPGLTCGFAWDPALSCKKNVEKALQGIPEQHKPQCRKMVQSQIFGMATSE